jgi:hypothetical protein
LPDEDTLRAQILQEHPGASIVRSSVCPTSYRPGLLFDLVLVPTPDVVMRMRHAFVAGPAGEVEFILSASSDEYDKNCYVVMAMLRAFRVEKLKPNEP